MRAARRAPTGSRAGIEESAGVFAALGDPTRLGLVSRLCEAGPQSVTRLTRRSGVTRQAVTKHLVVLEAAGLVRGTRRGRERLWEVEPRRIEETRQYLEIISMQWDEAIERLRAMVEG